MTRPLTVRERSVLDALLSVPFDGVAELRNQVCGTVVFDTRDTRSRGVRRDPMTISELHATLEVAGVHAGAYSLDGDENESYCLVEEAGSWHVFYSERGNRNNEAVFTDENNACRDLLERLLRDGSVRRS